MPVLAKLLKKVFEDSDQTKYYKNKPIYITIGYIGVYNKKGRNLIIKKNPYPRDFSMNKLDLTSNQKTEIKNSAHR